MRAKVLVVDDEEFNREMLEAILVTNYDITMACSGEEALEKVSHEPPDIILLDIMMPRIDGYEVCRRLKEKKETAIIPVVMVTALREKEDRIKGLEAGADDFLTKPIDRAEVLARVKSLLRIKHLYDELTDINTTLEQRVKEQVEELQRTHAERERLQKELEIARDIQQSFLPQVIPQIEGFELAAINIPAKEVGGDFYDFIPITEDKWGLVIADVSGKGIPAALFMALSRTIIRINTINNPAASEAICKANAFLTEESETSNMFVTLFYAILDTKKRSLTYTNAGHNPPLLIKTANGEVAMLEGIGIALGVTSDIDLEEKEIFLDKGSIIAFYTDGVIEAINDKKEEFGEERFIKVIKQNQDMPAQKIIEEIQQEIVTFSSNQPQFDDLTLVVLKI
ncbi:MAG: SpoIIE family protein phosphatase [bacterium]|nr:SpoIIE family protein phosphatase [bacterium]